MAVNFFLLVYLMCIIFLACISDVHNFSGITSISEISIFTFYHSSSKRWFRKWESFLTEDKDYVFNTMVCWWTQHARSQGIRSRALVDKRFCVLTCRLALNVMTCRYVLSLNKRNLYRCYSSCRQGNLGVDMSFIPNCHDMSTHIVVDKSTNQKRWGCPSSGTILTPEVSMIVFEILQDCQPRSDKQGPAGMTTSPALTRNMLNSFKDIFTFGLYLGFDLTQADKT